MNKLDECLKLCNLMYTDTCEKDILSRNDFDLSKEEVNYEGSISLFDLIRSFNKMYLAFKKEYSELEKIDLGREIDILSFDKYTGVDGRNYRILNMLITNPSIIDDKYTYLYMREINGVSLPFVSNDRGSYISDNGYYRKNIKLDAFKVKKYLDLFEKYSLLFDLYKYLNKNLIYSDGTFILTTKIDSSEDNFLSDMQSFTVNLGINHMSNHNKHISIKVNLGYGLNVDLRNCVVNFDGKYLILNESICLDILKKTFINGSHLTKEPVKEKEEHVIELLSYHL